MPYDLAGLKKKFSETKEWFKKELSLLSTGRASPALLDNISVNCYGAKTPIRHIAAISTEDARTLRVKPWDISMISQIEQEIRASGSWFSPVAEKDSLRIIFPELTEEKRKSLVKILNGKLEESRVKLRKLRDEWWGDIQIKEREGAIRVDEKFRLKNELQKMVDETNKELEEMADAKQKEVGEK